MGVLDQDGNATAAKTIKISGLKDREFPPFCSPNLLDNPAFLSLDLAVDVDAWMHTNNRNLFAYAPGWYTFGLSDDGLCDAPATAGDSPVYSPNQNAGLHLRQDSGKAFGILQRIKLPKLLSGRRVRLSVQFQVEQTGANGMQTGCAIYLVTKCPSVTIDRTKTSSSLTGSYWRTGAGGSNRDGVTLRSGSSALDIGHVVRATAPDATYTSGAEFLTPAFDWLGEDAGSGLPALHIGGVNDQGEDAGGIGADGVTQDMKVFYLPKNLGALSASTGGVLLNMFHATVADGTVAQEVWVEISEDLFDTGTTDILGDAWIVIMPVAYTSIASMTRQARVNIWGIGLEAVLDSVAATVLTGAALGLPGGGFHPPPSVRNLLQYPIYVPAILPCTVGDLQSSYSHSTFQTYMERMERNIPSHHSPGFTIDSCDFVAYAKQHTLPHGAVVTHAAWYLAHGESVTIETSLSQEYAWTPKVAADALDASIDYDPFTKLETIIAWDDEVHGGVAGSGMVLKRSTRHRIGFHWPKEDLGGVELGGHTGEYGGANDLNPMSSSTLWFRMAVTTGSGGREIIAQTGYIRVLVDPRAGLGRLWKFNA